MKIEITKQEAINVVDVLEHWVQIMTEDEGSLPTRDVPDSIATRAHLTSVINKMKEQQ